MLLEKGIDFWNGSYSCLVCQIELEQINIHKHLHLQGLQHATRAATREEEKNEKESKLAKKLERQFEEPKKLNECKQIDEPEVICLGNDNDERSSEDLPNPTIKDKMILDGLSALDVWLSKVERKQALKINESKKTKKNQIPFTEKELKELHNKGIDFVNGSFSCSVCKIELKKGNLNSHLRGKRHARAVNPNAENGTARKSITINISDPLDKKRVDFKNGKYFCSICQIKFDEGSLDSHLQGK